MYTENRRVLQSKIDCVSWQDNLRKYSTAKEVPAKGKSNVCICVDYAFDRINI